MTGLLSRVVTSVYPAIQPSSRSKKMPFGLAGAVEESLELYIVTFYLCLVPQ